MIKTLYIKDFILIQEACIQFRPGFTAITGETGAGKSILIGAIGLILGGRADTRTVREGATKAIIEATCDIADVADLKELFEQNDLDYNLLTTIRREVTATGKSRAFVNDTPVSATLLKQIGERLVDIHSQHHNMLIGDPAFQMQVVDALAHSHELRSEYTKAYQLYKKAVQHLTQAKQQLLKEQEQQELFRFQYAELSDAQIKPNEDAETEERMHLLQHAQDIIETLSVLSAFNEDQPNDMGVVQQLVGVEKKLSALHSHFSPAEELYERLQSVRIDLQDIISSAGDLLSRSDFDTSDLPLLENRYDFLQGLLYKYKKNNANDLIAERDRLGKLLENIENSDQYLQTLQNEVNTTLAQAKQKAQALTEERAKAAEQILPNLHSLLAELGIAGASFRIAIEPLPELSPTGADAISFLFGTNKQAALRPIQEIASGGEISRFMLALKTILSSHATLPTVIFDEIDTGVSGEVADKLGRVMQRLSKHLQVIAITHLPQIAVQAAQQLVVSKQEQEQGYATTIHEVKENERVYEIATMLSGENVTDQAIENARALLAATPHQNN